MTYFNEKNCLTLLYKVFLNFFNNLNLGQMFWNIKKRWIKSILKFTNAIAPTYNFLICANLI